MTCESITVTNTLDNSVCSGVYDKTEDTQEWVNRNNPTCKVVKIFDVAAGEYRWVFQIQTPKGAEPPPGAEDAVITFAPTSFRIRSTTYKEAALYSSGLEGAGPCAVAKRKIGESEGLYTLDPEFTNSQYNVLKKESTGTSWGYECKVRITTGGDTAYVTDQEVSYFQFTTANETLVENWNLTREPILAVGEIFVAVTVSDGAIYETELKSPTGNYFANNTSTGNPYWTIRFDVGGGTSGTNVDDTLDIGCLVSQSGVYETTDLRFGGGTITQEWEIIPDEDSYVQYLYLWSSGTTPWRDLIREVLENPDDFACWYATWYLETGVSSNTTKESKCPADADWDGLTVSEGADDGDGDGDGGGGGDVDTPAGSPADLTPAIVQPAGSPTDLNSDIVDDGDGGGGGGGTGVDPGDGDGDGDGDGLGGGTGNDPDDDPDDPGGDDDPDVDPEDPDDDGGPDTDGDEDDVTEPVVGPVNLSSAFVECSVPTRYKGFVFDPRTSSLSGPFVSQDITAVTTKDNSSEMYAVNSGNEILRTVVTDLNNTYYAKVEDPFTDLTTPLTESGVVMSKSGKGFSYRNRYKAEPFAESIIGCGPIEDPLYFKDAYLSIAETNWIHLGDEHNEKQIHRVDLRFHKNSVGHLFLYVQNDDGKVKGQYKGAIKEHVKVFTNLRARGIQICMMLVAHKDYPWAMREMAIGHLYGKSF